MSGSRQPRGRIVGYPDKWHCVKLQHTIHSMTHRTALKVTRSGVISAKPALVETHIGKRPVTPFKRRKAQDCGGRKRQCSQANMMNNIKELEGLQTSKDP